MATATLTSTLAGPATYAIDRAHSDVLFRVRHLLSRVSGRFHDFSGTIVFDEAHPESSQVEVVVKTASIDTSVPDRDAHLKSDDFFAVETYPDMSFVSTRIVPAGSRAFTVTGTLTIRGVSRTIDLPVSFLGAARDPWGNEKLGFEAAITLNRKDFGLTWNASLETGGFLVGDDIDVSLNVQAARA